MITLFKQDETNFDHNGLGSLDKNILETVVEEELNGLYSFVFKYPIFAPHGSEINGQSVIRVPTPDGNQLFRVYNPIKSMGYLTIKTYHIFYDLADNFIEDTNIVGKNGQGAISQLGGATQYSHTFRFFSDIETTTNARMVRINPVAALIDDEEDNTFISRWGGELKRNNFDIRMNKSIGTNRGKKIQHRKDLIGYEADIDWSTAITRIMPKGFDGLLLPEKYVDSPLINRYIKPKIKVVEYTDIKAAVGEYVNDKDAVPLQTAYQLLRERANEEYSINKVDIPEATYKVDFVSLDQTEEYKDLKDLQKVFLGDTVTVNHEEDGLDIEAKVISYKYDPLAKRYLGLELGSFKETFTSKYSDITKLTRKVTELIQTTNFIQSTADGKNTINRGTSEPLYPNVNDLWYKPNGSETELWQYVDENGQIFWKMISSTAELNTVKDEVEEIIQQADLDRAKANQDFTQAVTDAKNYTELKATEFDNQLVVVKQNVLTATNSANSAVTKADKAVSEAGFAKADSATAIGIANGAATNATTAINTANSAVGIANIASGNASNALSTAQTSLANSGTALTNAQNALNAYNNLEIGGRNYFKNSEKEIIGSREFINSPNWDMAPIIDKYGLIPYVISFDLKSEIAGIINVYSQNGTGSKYAIGTHPISATTEYKRYSVSFTPGNANLSLAQSLLAFYGQAYGNGRIPSVRRVKMEIGNKPTDWTPAPEDVQVQITNINGELSRKVSQTNFDTLNGTVANQGTQISQTQSALTAKAEKSLVDTINQTVSKHTTDIKLANDGLLLKSDKSVVDALNGTVATHTNQIKTNADGLALKADKSFVDTVKGTVDKQTLDIKANTDGLLLKASASLVDTIKSTVDSHTADLKINADGLKLKADSSLVNTIKGTVNQHGLDLTAQASQIAARLTSTQVDSLITGKNYVNQTALNATATGLSTQITQVETAVGKKADIVEKMQGSGKIFKNPISKSYINGSNTGYLMITTPITSSYMARISISGYNYVSKTSNFDIDISFYAYSGGVFLNHSYTNKGNYPINNVSVARTPDGRAVIIIGSLNSIWTYPNIKVTEAMIGFTTPPDSYQNGWAIDFSTSVAEFTNITNVVGQDYNTKITTIDATVNGITTNVSNHTGQISTLQQIATGLQTTVLDKADKTQVTQLSNQWTQTTELVTGHTGQISNLGQQINLRVTSSQVTEAILSDKKIKDTRNTNEMPPYYFTNYPQQTVEEFKVRTAIGVEGSATFGQLTTKVTWNSSSAGAVTITQTFSSSDGTFQRVSSAGGTIWLAWDKIAEAGKLVSQINLSPEGILIQGKKIQLDGDVTMTTAFVTRLDTLTLSAVYADIPTIRNKVLITDVVTANMIQADSGLFDKVFINDAVVQKLTVKSSFINSVKAIEITADKVNGGTANFANFNVINFNANNITSGSLNGANYSNNLNTGVETFRNPNNGSTLSIQQDKFYFNTSGASHYLIPDNEGLAFVPAVGNTGNNRNAGLRLQSTNFNFVDFGYGSDGGFLHRIGSYPDTLALINKDGGDFTFSHTGVLDIGNVNTRRWDLKVGLSGQLQYGKTAIQLNGYQTSTVPKMRVVNANTSALAMLDVGYLTIGDQPNAVELSNTGTSLRIQHATNRNWVFAEGLNGTLTYGITTLALNGHNNASARLSVFGAGGTSYGYMSAANFDVQSERSSKSEITDYNNALSLLSTLKIHQYIKNDKPEIGIITDEAPYQLLSDNNTKVALYDFISLTAKATQELTDITWSHEILIQELKEEIKQLKGEIK